GRQVLTSGNAMSGGGDLSADRTITLSESPNSASVVGTGRNVSTSSPLTGGGDLSADPTIRFQTASGRPAGCLAAADWTTFNAKGTTVTFSAMGNLASGNCLANTAMAGFANGVACPAAVTADTFTSDATALFGPIGPGGTTVSNLEATTNGVVSG